MNKKFYEILRFIFYGLIIRPILVIVLGFNVRHLNRLRADESSLIAANHNSHLDTLVLLSLFKLRDLPKVKVVAAKDYFCAKPLLEWCSINIIGIIPLDRKGEEEAPLAPVIQALEDGFTVVIFPEGSRGNPEQRKPLKYGISKILQNRPETKVTPIFVHGLGKSLPRGEALLVPFICEINIGETLSWEGDRKAFIATLDSKFSALEKEMEPKSWF